MSTKLDIYVHVVSPLLDGVTLHTAIISDNLTPSDKLGLIQYSRHYTESESLMYSLKSRSSLDMSVHCVKYIVVFC
jgi:hypothetical protein